MDNISVNVLGFQFKPERDSPQEPFFKGMMWMNGNRKKVVVMSRGNKLASWNDKLDLEVLYLYSRADTLKSDSN